ncbi:MULTISPECIES: BcsR/BcsP family cellulose biosynthesis protein [unclassified Paraburkholderia]|uniref:BcsR/BcsP family cellulose biosynthesis protein n=1 Tax=unclassified Paraburkholderia TaxID=2615204 RepID=UPI002AB07B55|nr:MULTISPECIES: BcsR/BcsP family cellulose biosynthesis protein [unclassified Paraburkholderia]
MSGASDIANLFEVAGGNPAQYQEVERTEQMQGSRGPWSASDTTDADAAAQPLFAWTLPDAASEPPPVVPEAGDAVVLQAQVQAQVQAQALPETVAIEPQVASAAQPEIAPQPVIVQAESAIVETDTVAAAPLSAVEAPVVAPQPATPQPGACAASQPAPLGSVFARLLARSEPRSDASPRGTP